MTEWCPYWDNDDDVCLARWNSEVPESIVVQYCANVYENCKTYRNERSEKRYRYIYCLTCMYDVEESYGWSAAKYYDFCPQCGSELVRRPHPLYEM